MRSQEPVTNRNLDTSNILKENKYDDPPWVTGRISVYNERTRNIKKDVSLNILKKIYLSHVQQHNADTYKLCINGF